MRAPFWRRVGATCVDYGLVGAWALVLAGMTFGVEAHDRCAALSPGASPLLGSPP